MPIPTNAGSGDRDKPQGGIPSRRPAPPAPESDEAPSPPYPAPRQPQMPTSPPPQQPQAPRPSPRGGYVDDSFEQIPVEEVEDEFYYDERPAPAPTPAIPEVAPPSYDFRPPVAAPTPEPAWAAPVTPEPDPEPVAPTPVDPEHDPQAAAERAASLAAALEESPEESQKRRGRKKRRGDDGEQPNFIDKKNKKLKPYGGKKSKKVRVSNGFDDRENRKQKAKIIQFSVIGMVLLLIGLGIFNAIPKKNLSVEDVQTIIATNDQALLFPSERGTAFTEDFLKAYLEITPEDSSAGDPLLGYFYTGTLGGEVSSTLDAKGDYFQRLLVPPRVYKITRLTEYSASFEATALVEPYSSASAPTVDDAGATQEEESRVRWVSYNVNLYYDKATDSMTVTKDSPTLLAPVTVGNGSNIPEEKKPGTGKSNDELNASVQSTVYGYLEAFSGSSLENHTAVDQYLTPDSEDVSLLRGFDGRYALEADPSSSIDYQAYETDDPSVTRVDATVTWADAVDDEATGFYRSRYLLELKQVNNKFFVVYFAPRQYSKAEDTPAAE